MIDILLAYNYDLITNNYEHISESGWNIIKLSATFSCFIDYSDFDNQEQKLKSAIISFMRRSLIFPLYRNFSLA